jgi:hypothetical protein
VQYEVFTAGTKCDYSDAVLTHALYIDDLPGVLDARLRTFR